MSLTKQTEQFVDQLLVQKGVSKNLAPEALEEIRTDLIKQVVTVAQVSMLSALPKEDADECVALLKDGKEEQVAKIVENKAENLGEIMTKALTTFRETYLRGEK